MARVYIIILILILFSFDSLAQIRQESKENRSSLVPINRGWSGLEKGVSLSPQIYSCFQNRFNQIKTITISGFSKSQRIEFGGRKSGFSPFWKNSIFASVEERFGANFLCSIGLRKSIYSESIKNEKIQGEWDGFLTFTFLISPKIIIRSTFIGNHFFFNKEKINANHQLYLFCYYYLSRNVWIILEQQRSFENSKTNNLSIRYEVKTNFQISWGMKFENFEQHLKLGYQRMKTGFYGEIGYGNILGNVIQISLVRRIND